MPFLISTAAMCTDLAWRIVPNEFLTAGFCTLATRLLLHPKEMAPADVMIGILIPLGLLAGFFYFRMIGAGDIKLLMLLGGLFGGKSVPAFLMATALAALAVSAVLMWKYKTLRRRLRYLAEYADRYMRSGVRISYRGEWEKGVTFHFTIPVWIGVLVMLTGIFG